MRSAKLLTTCSILGATAVIAGAFGAHALKERLAASGLTPVWEKAVLYHLVHAVACLAVALARSSSSSPLALTWLDRAARCWILGAVLFSGSLYALALGAPRWIGPVTPLGGIAFIAGWVCVGLAARASAEPEARG